MKRKSGFRKLGLCDFILVKFDKMIKNSFKRFSFE